MKKAKKQGSRTFTQGAEKMLDEIIYTGNSSDHVGLATILNNYGFRTIRGKMYTRKHIDVKLVSSAEWKTRAERKAPRTDRIYFWLIFSILVL